MSLSSVPRSACDMSMRAGIIRVGAISGGLKQNGFFHRFSLPGSSLGISTAFSSSGMLRKEAVKKSVVASSYAEETGDEDTEEEGLRQLSTILTDLNRKVPTRATKTRYVDGIALKYIPWFHANRILSFYAPGWHGEVKSVAYSPNNESVTVVYRITINAIDASVYREASGTASTKDDGYGDPVQKAEGMAFRRACARFGLGLYLYSEHE